MAKNKDRKLFGRGRLRGWMRDEDESRPDSAEEIDERRPAWAEDMASGRVAWGGEEEDAPEAGDERPPKGAGAKPAAPFRPADQGDEEEEPRAFSDGEEDADAPRRSRIDQTPQSRSEADEAWEREAQRVESYQFRRGPAGSGNGSPEDEEAPDGKSKKKNQKTKARQAKSARKRSESDERKSFVRTICVVLVCGFLFLMVALMVVSNFVSSPLLALPRKMVTGIVTPIQRVFSGVTDGVVEYLRMLKIRGNLEYEYGQLLIQLDDYATQLAQMDELRHTVESLYDLLDEQQNHQQMNPITATVIGHDTSNYFSTLTLNVGARDGVTDYMAVVAQGGLVGVTYNVSESKCDVRCIIDSDCTVAALVQSSRDQGSVKGTLGTNGEPMCRMYYLPDSSLPRPGDLVVSSGVGLEFPKSIPIGYIRESTRGMEANKSYVVVEPIVDFQHLEYVTVYRYRPYYAEEAQDRVSTSSNLRLETLTTARPVPTWSVEGVSDFILKTTPSPADGTPGADARPGDSPAPSPTPGPADTPTPTTAVGATPMPENLSYEIIGRGITPSPSPRPTNTPSPTPVPTPDPGAMTVEDDE